MSELVNGWLTSDLSGSQVSNLVDFVSELIQ